MFGVFAQNFLHNLAHQTRRISVRERDMYSVVLRQYKQMGGSPLCCKAQMAASLANSRASRLCVHPFDPLSARCGSHERIRKVLCFPRNLVAAELHDAHGVGRLAVICQDEFGDPKITAADDSSDSKPLFARLTSALVLYVASTAGSLA